MNWLLNLFGHRPEPLTRPDPAIARLHKWAERIAREEFPDREVQFILVTGIHETMVEVRSKPMRYWLAEVAFDKTDRGFYRVQRQRVQP